MKILPEMYVWTGKTDIEFWESSGSGSGSRNFLKGIFTIVVRDILYTEDTFYPQFDHGLLC